MARPPGVDDAAAWRALVEAVHKQARTVLVGARACEMRHG
jgi:hypothetical protein